MAGPHDEYDNSSFLSIDNEFTSQTDSDAPAAAQVSSSELLRRFREKASGHINANAPLQLQLPRLGCCGGDTPEPSSLARPPPFVEESPTLRPRFVQISDTNHAESLSSNTVVVLTSKHGSKRNSASGSMSVLPTPSGAHSSKTKVLVYDADALEEHHLAREWRSNNHLHQEGEMPLPLSFKGTAQASSGSRSGSNGAGSPPAAGHCPLIAVTTGSGVHDDVDEASTASSSLSHEMYGAHPSSRRQSEVALHWR